MNTRGNLQVETLTLPLAGKGSTPAEALERAFTELRQAIYGKVPGPVVYMAPTGVWVREVKEETHSERYLGLLWPRERREYHLAVTVEVEVRYVVLPV